MVQAQDPLHEPANEIFRSFLFFILLTTSKFLRSKAIGFHDKEIWRICQIIWQILSCTEQNKFCQKLPRVGLNPWLPDHYSSALPTELGSNLLGRRFLKWVLFVSCTTSHVGLYKGLNDSHRQPNSDLAQLVKHMSNDLEVAGSNPTGGNF